MQKQTPIDPATYIPTQMEEAIIKWQHGNQGSFYTYLWDAICCADQQNLARLMNAFPLEVMAYKAWVSDAELVVKLKTLGLV